jgi:hypothetical protein
MSLRRATRLAMLLATAAVALGSAVSARAVGESPAPLPSDQATALATAAADVPSGSLTQSVDGQTALNASMDPAADTAIESDLTPQAAVGITDPNGAGTISPNRPTCWSNYMWHQWGTWPYQQRITDTTYWCAVYDSHITFRTSMTTASGLLCGVSWRAGVLIAGGVGKGFTSFTKRSSAGFSCQTDIPWIAIHTTHHEDVKRNDRGVTTLVGSG